MASDVGKNGDLHSNGNVLVAEHQRTGVPKAYPRL
jgi:hypothetical protein